VKPASFMLIAGEPSGDMLAAELVTALRAAVDQTRSTPTRDLQPLDRSLAPLFFGAGGPRMAAAGVDLAIDLTTHAVFGLSEVLRHYQKFKGFFDQLLRLALDRQPDVIILVDYAGFNRRFAAAIQFITSRRKCGRHDRAARKPWSVTSICC
jgi:lipid-A-disaccharide synthase